MLFCRKLHHNSTLFFLQTQSTPRFFFSLILNSHLNVKQANAEAINWCKNEISNRVCSSTGTKPIDAFLQEEKPCLISLPTGEFDLPIWTKCKVHKDHHFVVKGNFYSEPV